MLDGGEEVLAYDAFADGHALPVVVDWWDVDGGGLVERHQNVIISLRQLTRVKTHPNIRDTITPLPILPIPSIKRAHLREDVLLVVVHAPKTLFGAFTTRLHTRQSL